MRSELVVLAALHSAGMSAARRRTDSRSEAERAGRHYRLLEPENRLVARQLAKDWERKLAEEQSLKEEYQRFLVEKPRLLSAS